MLQFKLIFGLATALLPYMTLVSSAALSPRQIQWPTLPNNLTEDVLQVAFAISPPCAVNNSWCIQLTTVVVPRCQRLRGDPGCWCGNHDPVHYCAICMSSPADNQTTPEQTQAAGAGHNNFHIACNAYEGLINGTTVTTTSTSSQSPTSTVMDIPTLASQESSSNKTPIGPIIGGVVGGVVGLALILGGIYLLALKLKQEPRDSGPRSSMSHLGSDYKSPHTYHAPYPQLNAYPVPGHVSPPVSTYMHNAEPMVIGSTSPAPPSQAQGPIQPPQT